MNFSCLTDVKLGVSLRQGEVPCYLFVEVLPSSRMLQAMTGGQLRIRTRGGIRKAETQMTLTPEAAAAAAAVIESN